MSNVVEIGGQVPHVPEDLPSETDVNQVVAPDVVPNVVPDEEVVYGAAAQLRKQGGAVWLNIGYMQPADVPMWLHDLARTNFQSPFYRHGNGEVPGDAQVQDLLEALRPTELLIALGRESGALALMAVRNIEDWKFFLASLKSRMVARVKFDDVRGNIRNRDFAEQTR